jgi:hypothetical protein
MWLAPKGLDHTEIFDLPQLRCGTLSSPALFSLAIVALATALGKKGKIITDYFGPTIGDRRS